MSKLTTTEQDNEQVQEERYDDEYEKLLTEYEENRRQIRRILGYKYIPPLSVALKKRYPNKKAPAIAQQIWLDLHEDFELNTVYKYLDSSVYDSARVQSAKKRWDIQHKKELDAVEKNSTEAIQSLPKDDPPINLSTSEEDGPTIGESNETFLTLYRNITEACDDLWKALTNEDQMPQPNEDLVIDHIKPTRERRQIIASEATESQLKGLSDRMKAIDAVTNDMIRIIDADPALKGLE